MKKIILSTIVASSLVVASNYKYEVTPTIGYVDTKEHVTLKNQKVAGVSVARNLDNTYINQIELGLLTTLSDIEYENSTKNSAIRRMFVNGIKEYKIGNDFKLYALAGLGCERIENEQFNNDRGAFFNYGVGIKYAITKTLSLKLGAAHLLKFDGDRNVLYTFGLSIPFGASASPSAKVVEKKIEIQDNDSDNDGVVDSKDSCPTTIAGIEVGANGCELDSDNDGIVNSKDQCPSTIQGTKVDTSGCEVLNQPENLGVLFENDSDKIKSEDLAKFDKYVNYLKRVSTSSVVIEAHTDSVGNANYNLGLSQRRAQSVKNQLVKMGISSNRIEAIGYGEAKPEVSNDTAEHRQINRRVTARIVTK